MPGMTLPPGFRFHPTDEELVDYYLKKRVKNIPIEFDVIADVDLYKCEPWDLPSKSKLPQGDNEWFFFSPRDRKYPNGSRTNRATEAGYWKATGRDRTVRQGPKTIGMKKTLVFYRGRAPHGERTDWLMHEYRLDGDEWGNMNVSQDAYVLCRVFKKNGFAPPKSGGSGSIEEGDQVDSPGEVKSSFADGDVKPSMSSLANLPPLPQPISRPELVPVEDHGVNGADSFATRANIFSDDPFVHNGSFRIPDTEDFLVDEGLDKVRNDEETLEDFYNICPPLDGNTLQLGDEDLYNDIPGLIDSTTKGFRNEFHNKWLEQAAGAYQAFGSQLPRSEELPYENVFGPLPTLVQLPSPPTASPPCEDIDTESSCVTSSNSNFAPIRLRSRPSVVTSSAVGNGYSPYTASRRVLIQHRKPGPTFSPQLAGESHPKLFSKPKLSVVSQTTKGQPELTESLGVQAPTSVKSHVDRELSNSQNSSSTTNLSPAPKVSSDEVAVDDNSSTVSASAFAPVPHPAEPTSEELHKSPSQAPRTVVDSALENNVSSHSRISAGPRNSSEDQDQLAGCHSLRTDEADVEKLGEKSGPTKKSLTNESSSMRFMGLRLLEPISALRDISESGHTSSKQKITSRELPTGIGSIHVNAVTVTCSCSSAGLPHVPTKACACYTTFWEGRCEKEKPDKEGSSTGVQGLEQENNPAPSSNLGLVILGILLPLLCVHSFILHPALSTDVSRQQFLVSFRDLLFMALGAVIFCLVQWRPLPLMRLLRGRRGVNSSRPSSDP